MALFGPRARAQALCRVSRRPSLPSVLHAARVELCDASSVVERVPLQAAQHKCAEMADVEQGSATTPRSPREVRPPTPEQIRAARNKLPETPAAPPPKDPRNLDYDDKCHCCLRVGATWLICGKKRGRWPLQWFVGPDWCCMLCTYTLVLVPTVAFIIFIGEHHWAARYGAVLTGGATLVAFSSAACSDPGIVYREAGQEETGADVHSCRRCDVVRPHEARHCYECQVCVDDLDHHCPWTGKCIGKRTLFAFHAFLICLSVHILFVVVGAIVVFAVK